MRPWRGIDGAVLFAAAAATLALDASGPETVTLHGIARIASRPAPNVVVWLDAPNATQNAQRSKIVLDQRNLEFQPHILAVRVGTTVDLPNNDRVFHNVFSFRDGKRFDLGMYPVGALRHVTFDRPGLSRIFCNIHPTMAAYVMTVDTPYFAVSNRSGTFTVASIPAGSYTYHAWRAGATDVTGTWRTSTAEAPLAIDWP